MFDYIFYLLGLVLIIRGIKYLPYILKYNKSNYKNESGIGLFKFLMNKGYFGEGLTFFELEKIPTYSKILANVYLPTEDGTTELDLIYIVTSGIYVLESKNYSGWIFGNERSRYWTSVIYKTKNKFLNPIWQNRTHIKYLKKALGDIYVKSIIVFSQRCEFKKLNVGNNVVIKRNQLRQVIQRNLEETIYSNDDIDSYYNKLKQYSNQSQETKLEHIQRMKNKKDK